MIKFDEIFWEDVYPDPTNTRKNNDQSPEPEPTDMKEDIAELSDDTVKQIYEILGVEPPMTIKWGAEHPDDSIYMEKQLNGIEVALTEILLTRGWLLLNEAYDMLGLPRSAAGCIVGWRLSHDGSTDNHVSLGLDKLPSDWKRQMRLGTMWSIFINPNVDGPIDSMPTLRNI